LTINSATVVSCRIICNDIIANGWVAVVLARNATATATSRSCIIYNGIIANSGVVATASAGNAAP
jgi:hypothetical protein